MRCGAVSRQNFYWITFLLRTEELSARHGEAAVPGPFLSLALGSVDVRALDEGLGKRCGELLGRAKKSDLIDAAIVFLSTDGDAIATSDIDDLKPLALAAGRLIDLIPV